jgi:Lon protease-like protein
MFPLGTVLFPEGLLPLRVFEPRYRAMVTQCLEGDRCFGVVLIARGSEVGGGDQRVSVGTRARIEQAVELPDGRFTVLAAGTGRLRVAEWLPEEPFPNAVVHEVPEQGAPTADSLGEGLGALRQVSALLSELGRGSLVDSSVAVPDGEPERRSFGWQLCTAAPLGALDRQRLLEIDDPTARIDELTGLLAQVADDVHRMLAAGGSTE